MYTLMNQEQLLQVQLQLCHNEYIKIPLGGFFVCYNITMIQSNWAQCALIGLLTVILAGLCWWGFGNGKEKSESKRIIKDAITMTEGFEEFRKDQNRYPATTEFSDANIMRKYITNFPPQTFQSDTCPENFEYYSATTQTYELRFCISKSAKGYAQGWNVLKP